MYKFLFKSFLSLILVIGFIFFFGQKNIVSAQQSAEQNAQNIVESLRQSGEDASYTCSPDGSTCTIVCDNSAAVTVGGNTGGSGDPYEPALCPGGYYVTATPPPTSGSCKASGQTCGGFTSQSPNSECCSGLCQGQYGTSIAPYSSPGTCSAYQGTRQLICPSTTQPTATRIPTPAPACNVACDSNAFCQKARDGCTSCLPQTTTIFGTTRTVTVNRCQRPQTPTPIKSPTPRLTNTPTPTRVPACNVSCTSDSYCQLATDGCTDCAPTFITSPLGTRIQSGNTCQPPQSPTPIPACNTPCSNPSACLGAQDGCTVCNPTTNTCRPPATPTPTLIPNACGVQCTRDADCQGTQYSGTNQCIDCSPSGICQVPPSPTPTLIPNACGVQCTRDADCQGTQYSGTNQCVDCSPNGICQVQPTNTPTPTPTPFNAAMCKCDGIEYTDLFSGQPATITSFGKVEGTDTQWARIVDQRFFLAEGAETIATIIQRSDAIPSNIVEQTASKVRYASAWNLTLPQLKQGATYRIWSQINCQPKTTTNVPQRVLIAQATQNLSFIDRMIQFLNKLFGVGQQTTTGAPTATPVPAGSSQVSPAPRGPDSLQLGTIYPVEVYQKTCSFIKFRFDTF